MRALCKRRFHIAALAALISAVCFCLPAQAVLPPGSHISLAARAPVVLIAGVLQTKLVGNMIIASCRVLAMGRGGPAPGSTFRAMFPQPLKSKDIVVGPATYYHSPAPGQVWLLFLLNPSKEVAKAAPYLAGVFHLASHGQFTQRLDKIPTGKMLVAKLPQQTVPTAQKELKHLTMIYRWAGMWLDRAANRRR